MTTQTDTLVSIAPAEGVTQPLTPPAAEPTPAPPLAPTIVLAPPRHPWLSPLLWGLATLPGVLALVVALVILARMEPARPESPVVTMRATMPTPALAVPSATPAPAPTVAGSLVSIPPTPEPVIIVVQVPAAAPEPPAALQEATPLRTTEAGNLVLEDTPERYHEVAPHQPPREFGPGGGGGGSWGTP